MTSEDAATLTADWLDAALGTGWSTDYDTWADAVVFNYGSPEKPSVRIIVRDGQIHIVEFDGWAEKARTTLVDVDGKALSLKVAAIVAFLTK